MNDIQTEKERYNTNSAETIPKKNEKVEWAGYKVKQSKTEKKLNRWKRLT